MISDFLNYQDVAPAPSDGEESRIIEVHNAFTGDNYEVAAGEKKTVILAGEHSYPSTLAHATINNSTVLSPTDEKASADEATGAPTPLSQLVAMTPWRNSLGLRSRGMIFGFIFSALIIKKS